jgi:hypothetical protein
VSVWRLITHVEEFVGNAIVVHHAKTGKEISVSVN